MSDQPWSNEQRDAHFLTLLDVAANASAKTIKKEMQSAIEAERQLSLATRTRVNAPSAGWPKKLHDMGGTERTVFWHVFWDYNSRHNMGLKF
jgi:diphthamide biosynthesis methyltransferase